MNLARRVSLRMRLPEELVTVADQGLSSLSNYILAFAGAHVLSTVGFGALTLALSLYYPLLGTVRAVVGEPHVLAGARDRPVAPSYAPFTLTVRLVLPAAVAGMVALVIGVAPPFDAVAAMALVLPFVLGADALRYIYFAARRPHAALQLDLTWTAASTLGLAALWLMPDSSAVSVIILWGVGGMAASVPHAIAARGHRSMSASRMTAHRAASISTRRRGWAFFADQILHTVAIHSLVVMSGTLEGLDGAASWGAVAAVFGPLNVLVLGLGLTILQRRPRATATKARGRHARILSRHSVILAAGVLVWSVLIATWPQLALLLLGDNRTALDGVLIPGAVMSLSMGLLALDIAQQKARASLSAIVRARLATLVLALGGGFLGVSAAGAAGGMWALSGASIAGVAAARASRRATAGYTTDHMAV